MRTCRKLLPVGRRSILVLVTLLGMATGLVYLIAGGGSLSAQETPSPLPEIIQVSGATGRHFEPALVDIGNPGSTTLLTVYRSERRDRPHGLYYGKSMDGGGTWTEDMPVSTAGSEGQPDLARADDATVWLVYLTWVPTGAEEEPKQQLRMAYRTSSLDGMNWGAENLLPYGVNADILSDVSIAASGLGAIYIGWMFHKEEMQPRGYFTRTDDGGDSWSPPMPITDGEQEHGAGGLGPGGGERR